MASTLVIKTTDTNAGSYGSSTATVEYALLTTLTTDLTVNDYLRVTLPSTHIPATGVALYLDTFTSVPVGGGVWDVSAKYSLAKRENIESQIGGPRYSYSGSVKAETVLRALKETRYSRTSGAAAVDMKKNINWTQEGIEGVSLEFPFSTFKLTRTHPANTFTVPVLRDLRKIQKHVNSDTWKSWSPGEILFDSFEITRTDDGKEEVVSNWTYSPNFTDINAADADGEKPFPEFGVIPKKGHEYLWVDWIEESDSATGKKTKKPLGIYVNKVYKTASFTANLSPLLG